MISNRRRFLSTAGAGITSLALSPLIKAASKPPNFVIIFLDDSGYADFRPFGKPDSATPLFLVIIARDLEDGTLDAVEPVGLFEIASWAEPADAPRRGSLSSAAVEWL